MKRFKQNILLSYFLILWPMILIWRVPFEIYSDFELDELFFLKTITFIAFIYGFIQTVKRNQKKAFLALVAAVCILVFNLSDRLFLGECIATEYVGESPGYVETKLYANGTYKVINGGIFGATKIDYYDYVLQDSIHQETWDEASSMITIKNRNYIITPK